MDAFSRYSQIKMYTKDEKHTSFQTPQGVYCYTVMPFRLKNAGSTYQRAMSTIFYNHLRKMVECHVDDIAVKRRDKNDHLRDLKTMFIYNASLLAENEPNKVLGHFKRQVPRIHCHMKRNSS